MILSRGRGYLFVHIPKTGGTAMAQALEDRALADDILIGDTPKAERRKRRLAGVKTAGRLWKHSTLADIDGLVTPEELAGLFCFTLVRNPWDRMVSYYHWLREQDFDHPAVTTAKAESFEGFLADRTVSETIAANPARRYMTDITGREHGNYLRLEHLQLDMGPLEARLGFTLELSRVNISTRKADYRSYYSPAGRACVARLCAEDIARFGYSF